MFILHPLHFLLSHPIQYRIFCRGDLYLQGPPFISSPLQQQLCYYETDDSNDNTVEQYHGTIGGGEALKTIRVYRGSEALQVGTRDFQFWILF